MELKTNVCPSCGAKLDFRKNKFGNMIRCEYCDSEFALPENLARELSSVPETEIPVNQTIHEPVSEEEKLQKYKKQLKFYSRLCVMCSIIGFSLINKSMIGMLALVPAEMIFCSVPILLARDKPVEKVNKVITAIKLYGLFLAEMFLGSLIGGIIGAIIF